MAVNVCLALSKIGYDSVMVPEPQPSPLNRIRPSRAWLGFVGLMVGCLVAAFSAYLATIAIAAALEFELGHGSIAYLELLDRWLDPGSRSLDPWGRLAVAVTNLAAMGAVALVLAVDHARRAGRMSGLVPPAVQGWLVLAGLAFSGFVWTAALPVLDRLARETSSVVGTTWNPELAETWWLYALAVIPIVTLGAIAEEVIFRGALPARLRGLGLAPAATVLLSSACFVAVHDSSDPTRITQLAIGALALSWTVHRLGRLEFAIGAHIAWNLAVYTWNARTLEVLDGTPPKGLDGYSTGEWLVLIIMACVPALVAETIVRSRRARLA